MNLIKFLRYYILNGQAKFQLYYFANSRLMTKDAKSYQNKVDHLMRYVQTDNLVAVEAILKAHNHLINKMYEGETLLAHPIRHAKNTMVKLLLDCGINVNNCNVSGSPALWYAIRFNNFEATKMLIEHGANIELNCLQPNLRSVDYAILFGFYDITFYLYHQSLDKTLKTTGQYEEYKQKLKIGRYVNFGMVIEGLRQNVTPNELQDHLTRPKNEKEKNHGCCDWFCGLLVWKDNSSADDKFETETERKVLPKQPDPTEANQMK